MEIKVSNAVSLFKENGHDLKGLMTLLYNAVLSEIISQNPMVDVSSPALHSISIEISQMKGQAMGIIRRSFEEFHPNPETAKARIAQFNQEYKELKELEQKIGEVSFWTVLLQKNKDINKYIRRKKELQEETISVVELINIAFYKFTQINGTQKQFFDFVRKFTE